MISTTSDYSKTKFSFLSNLWRSFKRLALVVLAKVKSEKDNFVNLDKPVRSFLGTTI